MPRACTTTLVGRDGHQVYVLGSSWAPAWCLGEIRGKDKTRSVPSDGFKAATCTVAGECMGRVYIQSVYPWTSGERGQDGSESSGKGEPRKAGRTRPGCSGNEGSDRVERDPHELLAKEESFS